jgi:predicted nucleic acid-binding protein
MSIFLDANIIFSGCNISGQMHRFLCWLSSKEVLITSVYAAFEAERNILAKRTRWHEKYPLLMRQIRLVPDAALTFPVKLAEKDRPILAAAIAQKCEFLVTGDKRDFGHLYESVIGGVKIVDYVTLAELMLERHK